MKKLLSILLFISLSLSLIVVKAQGTWTPRNPLPSDSGMFQGISGFSINGYGYAGLGENAGRDFDELWQFDPNTDSWTRKASFPGQARVAPASFVIGNNAYLVTGSLNNGGKCVTECWQYNSITNKWTQKANFPGAPRTYAVGFAINGVGYVGTGAKELTDFYKDFYAYDTAGGGSWSRVADFGGIARSGASGFAANGKGYVCFGQDSTIKYHGDMWEYDPVANAWTIKANIPNIHDVDSGSPHLSASGFVICNNIYVGSGDDTNYNFSPTFWKYNTILNTWTQQASVPGKIRIQGAAFSILDTGYYGFGDDQSSITFNTFSEFYGGDSCNSTVGIKSITTDFSVNIYPNPFNEICHINLTNSNNVPVFALFNMEGMKQKIDIQGNNNYYSLKRNGLKQGIYILSIEYNYQVYYYKLVITD